ncbi:carbon monoxide dehydrogenase [Carbonactinospora thermoautotrophica]|uniref:Carbon monoxide dehydrogenase n=2 Tax=Carbonactinospora thermoautotrophica TaxID=1469144 RepID=A0A132MS93_9ACTN|nr:carbon monoxide dehydrogenase subunit G [Carbonactinospora thermoautotrophica]KWX00755.1 Carbon monoxide dehydrogenase subunit G [Carbonactinospora thermoautotrophica]KWX05281.1 carbon monoxide dehydrogenase [Carbonactinospora thermoautotrophica]
MKINGTATLHAPVEKVWQALNDPAVLVRTIPGCERLEEIGADEYRMTVTAGVGGVKGVYQGTVRLSDQQHPTSFVLRAAGAGVPGTVDATVLVTLKPDGDGVTLLSYDADAVVGGPVGGVGQRMLAGVAKKTAGEFFQAVDEVLAGAVPVEAAAAAPAVQTAAAPGVAETPAAGARVFTAPARAGAGQLWPVVAAAWTGGLLALGGVAVGWLLGRRHQ